MAYGSGWQSGDWGLSEDSQQSGLEARRLGDSGGQGEKWAYSDVLERF